MGLWDYCLASNEQLCSYIMARTSYIRWDYDDIRCLPNQHDKLYCYSASLLEQSVGKHISPLQDITLIPTQSVFVLTP
jgi:hypothetical protein